MHFLRALLLITLTAILPWQFVHSKFYKECTIQPYDGQWLNNRRPSSPHFAKQKKNANQGQTLTGRCWKFDDRERRWSCRRPQNGLNELFPYFDLPQGTNCNRCYVQDMKNDRGEKTGNHATCGAWVLSLSPLSFLLLTILNESGVPQDTV